MSFVHVIITVLLFAQASASAQIKWDRATLRLIERGADYGRMVRLGDGAIACAFDRDRKMWVRRSSDEGMTWGEAILVAEEQDCWLTNADVLVLKDGTVLYFWNERPLAALKYQHIPPPPGALTRPFRIRVARSADHGRTWSSPETIFTAGTSFQDGCWEPAAIELSSGELHVYFANESRFLTTHEQEISLLRSSDGGRTWSAAQSIALRRGHRDGMPAPLLLAGERGIIVAIEDNGLAGGAFKPAIIHTPLQEYWRDGAVEGESARRWAALAQTPAATWYGGAPCLRQLPSGQTLLSFQESDDGKLTHCRMAVCIGDRDGRNFTDKSLPFGTPARGNQAWNSLFIKDADTVTAISSATIDGTRGVWAIDGHISTVE